MVDDAIVVVENVERNIREGLSPRDAAYRTMEEVGGALIAIALVLTAVFIPSAFLTGILGQFFRQFAVTIATATVISLLVSLTLSPALCALLFKPHEPHRRDRTSSPADQSLLPRLQPRLRVAVLALRQADRAARARLADHADLYAGLIGLTVYQFARAPTGFIPQQDQGYLINIIQLPPGASLARTDEVARRVTKIVLDTPGIAHTVPIVGLDGATFTNAPNAAVIFRLSPPSTSGPRRAERDEAQHAAQSRNSQPSRTAFVVSVSPPPCAASAPPAASSWRCRTSAAASSAQLEGVATMSGGAANQTPGLANVFTTFNTRTPKV